MIDYTVETTQGVQEAVERLQAELKQANFGVLHIYNLKEIFKSKGIEFSEYQILSVCSPKIAKEALDTNLKVGAMLPCKISVYADGGTTKISLLKPTAAIALLNDPKLNTLSQTVEKTLTGVIDTVKKGHHAEKTN